MASPDANDAARWQGRAMIGIDGNKIGKLTQVYETPDAGAVRWASVCSRITASLDAGRHGHRGGAVRRDDVTPDRRRALNAR